jgi:hypothetical protein
MADTETFRSRVDGSFVAAAAVVIGVGLLGAYAAATAGTFLMPAVVILPAIGLVLWIWKSTRYVVTDTSLLVRCAFVRIAVPLAAITRLQRTSTMLSAPALSFDRLEVQHSAGSVVISPADRDRFVTAITSRNPGVDVEGAQARTEEAEARLRRHARTLGLAVTAVLIVVSALVVALNLYELKPPRVTVTAAAITVESGPARMAVIPEQITRISLEETLPPLRKRFGWSSFAVLRGRFSAGDAAGWVHVVRRRPPYMVLLTVDGFMILNDSDPVKTKATYDAIVERWPALRTQW